MKEFLENISWGVLGIFIGLIVFSWLLFGFWWMLVILILFTLITGIG